MVAQSHLLIPIEQVPLGARMPTKNPRPWEYDDSLPEPDQESWAKLSLTMYRTDGGIVDAELIRPKRWIKQHGIEAGQLLPMHIEELQVGGSVLVTAVEACPEIASGEGSVVTARFCTREVHEIVRAEILGPDGEIEVLEGTPIHPIWSVDRQDWVPLGELEEGEQLQAADGLAVVLTVRHLRTAVPVYNVEVHGEHVYEVGHFRLLVHNSYGHVLQKDLDHIILRHWPTSTASGAGKFAPGTSGKNLIDMVKNTVKNGASRPNTNGRPGSIFEHDFGRQIGINTTGGTASKLRVVLRPDGTVVTAFPY